VPNLDVYKRETVSVFGLCCVSSHILISVFLLGLQVVSRNIL